MHFKLFPQSHRCLLLNNATSTIINVSIIHQHLQTRFTNNRQLMSVNYKNIFMPMLTEICHRYHQIDY
ncbi:unnamed protein product [Rotaria magnacalcarata]